MKVLASTALFLCFVSTTARAQVNAGEQKPEPSLPFTMTSVATFNLPWRIAFLPDGRMLITEKVGPLWLVTQQGAKTAVTNGKGGATPAERWDVGRGIRDVAVGPDGAVWMIENANPGLFRISPK